MGGSDEWNGLYCSGWVDADYFLRYTALLLLLSCRTVRFWDLEKFQVVSCIEEDVTPVKYVWFGQWLYKEVMLCTTLLWESWLA